MDEKNIFTKEETTEQHKIDKELVKKIALAGGCAIFGIYLVKNFKRKMALNKQEQEVFVEAVEFLEDFGHMMEEACNNPGTKVKRKFHFNNWKGYHIPGDVIFTVKEVTDL